MSTVPYPQFRGNAENSPFLVPEAPVPRRNKILGNVLVCLKENCPGFQHTPSDICQGSLYPFFMSKLKSFDAATTFPYNGWRPSNDDLIPENRIRR